MSERRRLFIGLMAGPEVQRALARHQAAGNWPKGTKLVQAENFHLTLTFLGLVDAIDEARLVEALAAVPIEPFELVLSQPGSFHGGIAWIAPEHSVALGALHEHVMAAVRRAGMEAQEEWTPHVTLARKADGVTGLLHAAPIHWTVQGFQLVCSTQGQYRQIAAWQAARTLH